MAGKHIGNKGKTNYRKKWKKPILAVLCRPVPENHVLDACKVSIWNVTGDPSNYIHGCFKGAVCHLSCNVIASS